jgi:hypothetical protein
MGDFFGLAETHALRDPARKRSKFAANPNCFPNNHRKSAKFALFRLTQSEPSSHGISLDVAKTRMNTGDHAVSSGRAEIK